MFLKPSVTLNHQSNRLTDTSGTFVTDSSRPVEDKKTLRGLEGEKHSRHTL